MLVTCLCFSHVPVGSKSFVDQHKISASFQAALRIPLDVNRNNKNPVVQKYVTSQSSPLKSFLGHWVLHSPLFLMHVCSRCHLSFRIALPFTLAAGFGKFGWKAPAGPRHFHEKQVLSRSEKPAQARRNSSVHEKIWFSSLPKKTRCAIKRAKNKSYRCFPSIPRSSSVPCEGHVSQTGKLPVSSFSPFFFPWRNVDTIIWCDLYYAELPPRGPSYTALFIKSKYSNCFHNNVKNTQTD